MISIDVAYAEMNSGNHDRFSGNWFREIEIIFKKTVFYKMMFQSPKG